MERLSSEVHAKEPVVLCALASLREISHLVISRLHHADCSSNLSYFQTHLTPAITPIMRRDICVPNESDGFVFTSCALRARGISPGDRSWVEAIAACDLLPLVVESEDPANVRVVVDEALDALEQSEWVGVVRSALRVPDGRLALCGGIIYLLEPEGWAEECARVLEIAPGDYRATLYSYASAPNGRLCVERSGSDAPLGTWFRQTRPGQAMPVWLHNLCVHDPSLDPGHEKQWRRAAEKPGGAVIDFLLHLESIDGPLVAAAATSEGFMEAAECRHPDPSPLGIPAVGLSGALAEAVQDEQLPQEAERVVPKASAAGSVEWIPIAGGPVELPVPKLARFAQIAWMCHPYTHPELRVTFPGKPPSWEDLEDADCAISGSEWRITFLNHSQPADALLPLTAVAKQLTSVPDGTALEFRSSRPRTKSPLGNHGYLGEVLGGQWRISDSSPRVEAACLTEALALAEALENGRRLALRDESEAIQIEALVMKVLADYFGANTLQRTGAELALRRRDPVLFGHVVARIFWSRYAQIWPLQSEDV